MSHVSRYLDPALLEHLNQMELSARSIVEGSITGEHRSPLRGASVEFRQHRSYVRGDEPRRLDWRVLARTDRPYVREYEEETNLRCALLLDVSGSMAYDGGFGSKFEYGARLTASLAYLMLGHTESVGLGLCGESLDQWIAPSAAPNQISRLLALLERSAPSGASGVAPAMHEAAERLPRRSLVIGVSDFFQPVEPIRAGLAHLRHKRHEVLLIQVTDRDEETFPFSNWCRLIGAEGEGALAVEPAVARAGYQRNFQRHRRDLSEACRVLGARFRQCVCDRPLLEAIRSIVAGGRGGVAG